MGVANTTGRQTQVIAVATAVVAIEILSVATAVLWVWIYSNFVNTGGTAATYEEYAKVASPIVALVGGTPIFFFACLVAARYTPGRALQTAVAIVVVYVALDIGSIAIFFGASTYDWIMVAINSVAKAVASFIAGKIEARRHKMKLIST